MVVKKKILRASKKRVKKNGSKKVSDSAAKNGQQESDSLTIGKHTIALSNRDKLIFPESGITKGELVDYYARIAGTMLPYT
ncbi:MAG: hypothetical protein U1E02_40175, partial [Hydrogenophaga sp.]|nr:hypothetical protein [Hydrogenophaga sp.]